MAEETVISDKEKFKVNKELLYDGQGKHNNIITSHSTLSHMTYGLKGGQEGLQAPSIIATGDTVIDGLRKAMQKDSKQWQNTSSLHKSM